MKIFTKDEIKEIFKDVNIKYARSINKILNLNKDLKEFCEFIFNENLNFYTHLHQVILFYINDMKFKYCDTCNKLLTYDQIQDGFNTCSRKCQANNKTVKEKIYKTCLEKYNGYPMQNEEIKEKSKNTCLKKYGYEVCSKAKSVKEKYIKSCIEKYGVDNPNKCRSVREKIENTCLKKYGSKFPIQNKEVKFKVICTSIKNGGIGFLRESIRQKIKETNIEKYGVDNPWRSKEIIEKIKDIRLSNKYDEICNRFKDIVIPLFSKEEFEGVTYYKKYMWKCVKCGNEFEDCCHSHIPRCLNCFPKINGFSYEELDLLDFCKQYFPSAAKDKNLIKPLELDILIPEIKLAIEFNGIYYHSIERAGNGYHLNKTKLCNEKGYRLIHIWEDEWSNDSETIKAHLKSIFKGTENLNFTNDEIILDRSWYNNIEIPGYILKEEIEPRLVDRDEFVVEDCGYLKYAKF